MFPMMLRVDNVYYRKQFWPSGLFAKLNVRNFLVIAGLFGIGIYEC
jgi:hypothetical protein